MAVALKVYSHVLTITCPVLPIGQPIFGLLPLVFISTLNGPILHQIEATGYIPYNDAKRNCMACRCALITV